MKTHHQYDFYLFRKGSISLRCFKLCASCGWGAENNSQVVNSPGEPVRQVREPSKGGSDGDILLICNKAGRLWFWGVDVQENSGGTLKLDHAFEFCLASFLMTIDMGRIPHVGSWHTWKKRFLWCPMVKTPYFHCRGHGFDSWSEKFYVLQGAAKK